VTSNSKSSAAKSTKLLKLGHTGKATLVHALQSHDSAGRINFCNWFLQSVHNSEVDPQLTSFSDEAWFHLHKHVFSQNNQYWSLIHKFLFMM
jgi:hypothetical protein